MFFSCSLGKLLVMLEGLKVGQFTHNNSVNLPYSNTAQVSCRRIHAKHAPVVRPKEMYLYSDDYVGWIL